MSKNIRIIGSLLLIFTSLNLLISSMFIFLNKSIEAKIFYISYIILVICFLYIIKKINITLKESIIYIFSFTLIVIGCIQLSEEVYDFSYDGQGYHQEALIQLKEGWNPLYDDVELGNSQDLWINHYAKAPWYLGTVIYQLTGNIESAKAFNLILLVSTIFLLTAYLQEILKNSFQSKIITLLMIFSPVVINQMFTNYNDFLVQLLIIQLLVSYLSFINKNDPFSIVNTFSILLLITNIKFTALGYAMILTLIPFIIIFREMYLDKKYIINKGLIKLILAIICGFLIGILFIGSASYVKNTIDHGHPFYPLAGEGKVDIIGNNIPVGLSELNRIEKLYVSIFSVTSNSFQQEPQTKLPVSIQDDEVFYSSAVDTRIGGFGPLFGLIIILTYSLLLISLMKINKKELSILIIIISVIMFSVLINSETWWARYIPQFWLVPLIILVFYLKEGINRLFIYLISLVFIVNISLVFYQSSSNLIEKQKELKEQIEELKELSENKPIKVDFGAFGANRIRFIENEITYEEIKIDNNCENVMKLTSSTAQVCLDEFE